MADSTSIIIPSINGINSINRTNNSVISTLQTTQNKVIKLIINNKWYFIIKQTLSQYFISWIVLNGYWDHFWRFSWITIFSFICWHISTVVASPWNLKENTETIKWCNAVNTEFYNRINSLLSKCFSFFDIWIDQHQCRIKCIGYFPLSWKSNKTYIKTF